MAPAAQAEAIGSRRHAADRQTLPAAVTCGLMKARTWPKSGAVVGLRGIGAREVGAVRGADSGDPGRQVASSSVAAPSLPVRLSLIHI